MLDLHGENQANRCVTAQTQSHGVIWFFGTAPCRTTGALIALTIAGAAQAQNIDRYFSPAIPGFGSEAGVTVLSRTRPLYDELGVHVGDFLVQPRLDEYVGYDSNINGFKGGPSSAFVQTSPSVTAASDWSRNRLGVTLGLDNYTYFGIPNQNYTNLNAALGLGYTIGRHDLSVGYTHIEAHERGTDIGAASLGVPVSYRVDAVRSDYPVEAGRFTFTPNLSLLHYQFDDTTVAGIPVIERFRDRYVVTGGITTRYELAEQRSLLLIAQGSTSQFTSIPSGTPSPSSATALILAGIDYQTASPVRYRLLVGAEVRQFEAASFGNHAAPVFQGNVIWTPTGLTTVTGLVRREIEDPESELTSGYTLTTVGLTVDHELKRNVLLQGRGTFLQADYLGGGGGSSSAYSAGAGVTWLVNRNFRLSADYDFTRQTGTNNTNIAIGSSNFPAVTGTSQSNLLNTLTSGNYIRNVFLLGLHLRL